MQQSPFGRSPSRSCSPREGRLVYTKVTPWTAKRRRATFGGPARPPRREEPAPLGSMPRPGTPRADRQRSDRRRRRRWRRRRRGSWKRWRWKKRRRRRRRRWADPTEAEPLQSIARLARLSMRARGHWRGRRRRGRRSG